MNINEHVEIKLTDYGRSIYDNHFLQYGVQPLKLKDNILKTELWEVMHIFGEFIYMGNRQIPFEKNEVKILKYE